MEASDGPAMPTKAEPQDDDASSTSVANSNSGSQSEGSESVNSRRANAPDGKPFSTQCFELPYLNRPHFHRLKCGHDIATPIIERCGANCCPPTRSTGSDAKPSDANFECPECARNPAVKRRINPTTKRRIYGRPCQLAHVRGRDVQADLNWEVEKKHLAELRGRAQRVNPKDKELLRKTSRSPVAQRAPMAPQSQPSHAPAHKPAHRGSIVSTTEQPALEIDDATRQLFLAQKGKRTRPLRSDLPETKEGTVLDTADRSTPAVDIDVKLFATTAGTSKIAPLPSFVENVDGQYDHCGHCDAPLSGRYFDCEDCKEDDQNYTLCGECNKNAYALHLRTNPSHRMVLRQSSPRASGLGRDAGAGLNAGCIELRCVCKSPNIRFMLSCQDCSRFFHPGCIGKGAHDKELYESPGCERLFEADFQQIREIFLCHACDALHKLNAGIAAQRRNTRKHEDLLLEFKPKLMARKKMAFRAAKTLALKVAVNEHFAAIEAQMDEAINLEFEHWKSLLAQASDVPIPKVQARKRYAEDTSITPGAVPTGASISHVQSSADSPSTAPVKKDVKETEGPSQKYKYGGLMTLPMAGGKQG